MKFLTLEQLDTLKTYAFLIASAELAKQQHDDAVAKAIKACEWVDITRHSIDTLEDLFPAKMEETLKAFGLKNLNGYGHKIIEKLISEYLEPQKTIQPTIADIKTKRDVIIKIG